MLDHISIKLNNFPQCISQNMPDNTAKTRIAVEIAHGMFLIHSKSFIMRNFKIMLNSKLEAKITDFGHSKFYKYLDENDNSNYAASMFRSKDSIGSLKKI